MSDNFTFEKTYLKAILRTAIDAECISYAIVSATTQLSAKIQRLEIHSRGRAKYILLLGSKGFFPLNHLE
ncbi:MAG: hypothetical protein QM500_01235 [Methylococcales bacterium]